MRQKPFPGFASRKEGYQGFRYREEDILVDLDSEGPAICMTLENAATHIADHGVHFERITRFDITQEA
ncbi:MAG: hypothetical protein ABIP97_04535 [Chthoniobacterales bacterium]